MYSIWFFRKKIFYSYALEQDKYQYQQMEQYFNKVRKSREVQTEV